MRKYQNLRLFSFLVVGLDLISVELALFLGGMLAGLECLFICSYVGKYSGLIEKKTGCCTLVRKAAIFHLRSIEEVVLDPEPNGAGYKTHRVPSYDLDTPSDALENQIGPSVWPL